MESQQLERRLLGMLRTAQCPACRCLPLPQVRFPCSPCTSPQNLTPGIRSELLEERDPHGNVQVIRDWNMAMCR